MPDSPNRVLRSLEVSCVAEKDEKRNAQELTEEDKLLHRLVGVLVDGLLRGAVGTNHVGEGDGVPDLLVCVRCEQLLFQRSMEAKRRTGHELDQVAILRRQASCFKLLG